MRLCSARPTAILLFLIAPFSWCGAQESTSPSADTASETQSATTGDPLQELQSEATKAKAAQWGHWGNRSDKYDGWGQHSNRLVPVYTIGITLDKLREQGSVYRDAERLRSLYGSVPEGSVNPTACYFDQTNVYDLQMAAVEAGYSNIILMVFDGMDWQTTRAASLYKTGRVGYDRGRGTGLSFQDYSRVRTDFGLIVTSPRLSGSKTDVDSQTVLDGDQPATGGYHPILGGNYPSREISAGDYLIGKNRLAPHSVTDSAASASSMTTGVKTFNGSINVAFDGTRLEPIARVLQRDQEFRVGVVSSVPVSHATPAASYANNVSRKDYQDISRDLLGLPSASHRSEPLPGVDVLIGGGWGEGTGKDKLQGNNFLPGNKYLHQDDLRRSQIENGGRYQVAQRTAGESGRELLLKAAQQAADDDSRLLGFFGSKGGHLPFQTADGDFVPTFEPRGGAEKYSEQDLLENPTLADMTEAALLVLEQSIDGFWLLIEAGDVDWANHANNIDNSIGAVLSGASAFDKVTQWIELNDAWDMTAVIVTADHGHFLVIEDPQRIADAGPRP